MIVYSWLAFTFAFLVVSLLEVLLSTSIMPACWIMSLLGHQGVDLGFKAMMVSSSVVLWHHCSDSFLVLNLLIAQSMSCW